MTEPWSKATINTICHYFSDDINCNGDYTSLDVEIILHESIAFDEVRYNFSFGDSYHDKSYYQLDGMIKLLQAMGYEITEHATRVNDFTD